ncbi:multicopy suppressor of stt4 mutation [Paecilomyces variotii No. 5]|uniref:1-phosphatidylinositol-4-phosphate 5-kinase n=1 Tax=Byssochlamys spectabilis (strain No. 5 / NBRC 109023) TaxID=1356009 RepID=V5HS67_BYSSN|nr:multicopy suppressor of stt4 mutation [Paecilomyces variotii No. 5]
MPSFAASESQYQTATTNSSHPFDQPHRKSHDKTPVGNTFLYTPNGDSGHFDPHQSDPHPLFSNLKNGSAYSLNGPRSSIGSHNRELLPSKESSTNSLAGGAVRESKETRRGSTTLDGQATTKSTDMPNGTASTSKQLPATPQVNGESSSYRSAGSKPTTNGDYYPRYSEEIDPKSTAIPVSASAPDPGRSSIEPDRLAPGSRAGTGHRYSSPPVPSPSDSSQTAPNQGLAYRHTLQVPRTSTGRRNSREVSEDTATASGRFSPTGGMRRTSMSLARRTTRSLQSDLPAEEVPPDEDAARWAEAIKQKRARKKRREEEDDDRVIVGTKVDQNHVNWVTAYNMLTGIRFTVSRINAKMDRELTDADFEAKQKFSFDITGNELTPSAKYDFKFKDYAPWVFRRLRAQFKLDPADYLMSLTSKYILSELGSPGKSGSFFYFSRDYKYIIKTIHHSEHKLLRRILRDYYHHIMNNPNTLISQFYGLHRVKMAYGRKIHFVVMNNLFPPHRDIHQMYDLKGSTIGRDLREEDLEKNPRATMKDLNWLRRNRHLECGPMKKEIFIAQLKRDVRLLQKLKIMDYSLLVGIHDLQKGNEEKLRDKTLQVFQPGGDRDDDESHSMLTRTPSKLESARKARELRMTLQRERPVPLEQTAARMPDEILDERKNLVFYSDDGGFRATHENGQPGDEIYYLGIIDCLTHYGMVKKAEHFWKGLSHNRTQISPIPPESYGERFINFITGITMSKEEAERQSQARASSEPNVDPARGQGFHEPAVERTMRAAEKQAAKDGPEPQTRTLTTMRDPTDASSVGPSTLPVVQEDGEVGSTGSAGQNERSPVDIPPPVPEKDGVSAQGQANGHHPRARRGTLTEKSDGVDYRENGRLQAER